jgi:hypothetical protein
VKEFRAQAMTTNGWIKTEKNKNPKESTKWQN